ncbi:DUF1287 domain-containing protein [Simiduia curdlanivorans]|uniref:DUF1287 domain-containing protein n=1 Tax=Simiduia curdlanivorans TaxID=1492769 RepID=A0ABV8UZ10_9GAMM|nr:DUF1287 domain-containing protein [Simiduia curdlanivorans]MDN3639166.1 DUF1287 domain-containing protein [Simiduia curdlanivorans]
MPITSATAKYLITIASLVWLHLAQAQQPLAPRDIVQAAMARLNHSVHYDGRYHSIAYPNGDVPANIGVCTDVIVRAYRSLGIDLQQNVHEDMAANFSLYPSKKIWGLNTTDTNIDHRRVPNLEVYFQRFGTSLPLDADFQPGDLVSWRLPGNLPHIGIVVDEKSDDKQRYKIVHNIGRGPSLDDMLFDYPIVGHFRYLPTITHP